MKFFLQILAALFCSNQLIAGDAEKHELGNGATLEVRDGKVHVDTAGPKGSISQTANSRTDAQGNTITNVSVDKNGQRSAREVHVTPDGKVTITDPDSSKPPTAATPSSTGGWLGVHTIPLGDALRSQLNIPDGQGIMVEFIAPGGPAAKAGIATNDILLTINGATIKDVASFRETLGKCRPNQQIIVGHLQKGQQKKSSVILGTRPPDSGPNGAVNSETDRLKQETQANTSSKRRTVVVDDQGHVKIIEGDAAAADPFELLLKDPNVPPAMKAQLRKSQASMRQAEAESASKNK